MLGEENEQDKLEKIRQERQKALQEYAKPETTPIPGQDQKFQMVSQPSSSLSPPPGTLSNSQPMPIRPVDDMKQSMLKFLEQQREHVVQDNELSPLAESLLSKPSKKLSPMIGDDEEDEEEKSEEDQDFDMFDVVKMHDNQLDNIRTKQIDQQIQQSKKEEECEDQDYDDQENYLRIKTGDIMNQQYKITSKLGKGVFSNVVKVQDVHTGQEYAIKILRNDDIMVRAGEREKQILEKINQGDKFDKRHIIRIYGSFDYKKHLCLVFEALDMNLRDALKVYSQGKGFPIDYVRSFGQQLFKALYHMRKEKIIHADIKPDNILISKDTKTIKLCDFGTAFPSHENTLVEYLVSRYYRAPEIIIGYVYGMEIDVWSTGTTLFELFTGNFLFEGRDNNHMIKLILQKKGKFNNKMLKQGVFINKYFDKDFNFMSKEVDPVTKQYYLKTIKFGDQPTHDLGTLLGLKNIQNQDEYKKLNNFRDLLEKCLILDPKNRITPEEALNHPFLNPTGQKKLI